MLFKILEHLPYPKFELKGERHKNIYTPKPVIVHILSLVRVVVSYKQKYVHDYWLTACSSLPRKKVWLGELTVRQ